MSLPPVHTVDRLQWARAHPAYLSAFEKKEIYGVALSAPPEVMYPAVRARARQVSEQLRQVTLERIRASGVHLVQGEGRLAAGYAVAARTGRRALPSRAAQSPVTGRSSR